MTMLANVSLEMTPKPLFRKDDGFVLDIFRKLFRDWDPLLRESERISFLWWLSDGSDLLVYNRDLGGRIAIWHGVLAEDVDRLLAGSMKRVVTNSALDTYTGTFTAVNGADKVKSGFYPPRSEPGTAWFVTVVPPAATMVIVR